MLTAEEAGALDGAEGGVVGEFLGEGGVEGEGGMGEDVWVDGGRGVDVCGFVVLEVGVVGG